MGSIGSSEREVKIEDSEGYAEKWICQKRSSEFSF